MIYLYWASESEWIWVRIKHSRIFQDNEYCSRGRAFQLQIDRSQIEKYMVQDPTRPKPPSRRAAGRTEEQKFQDIYKEVKKAKWSIGRLLFELLRERNTYDPSLDRAVQSFLSGENEYTAMHLVHLMYRHKYSRPNTMHDERNKYFTTEAIPDEIKYFEPALSSFALQLILAQSLEEAKYLCSPEAGLRYRVTQKKSTTDWRAVWVHGTENNTTDVPTGKVSTRVCSYLNPHALPSRHHRHSRVRVKRHYRAFGRSGHPVSYSLFYRFAGC